VAANVNMPSDFPRHHRSTSPDRAEVLMVALVTIASVVVCGWIAVWLLSDVGVAWLEAVARLGLMHQQGACLGQGDRTNIGTC
jgi:hypothetical protein